jgi:hypothetical protein
MPISPPLIDDITQSSFHRELYAPSLLSRVRDGALNGAVLRGVFEPDEMQRVVDRLESEPSWRAPLSNKSEIELVGLPLQWVSPDRGDYLEAARHVDKVLASADLAACSLTQRLDAALGALTQLPVRLFTGRNNERYTSATLRRIPAGASVGAHYELGQFEAPSYGEIIAAIQTTTIFSYYLMLQTPEQGGQLLVYSLRADDPESVHVKDFGPDSEVLQQYPSTLIEVRQGDLLVFDSGRYVHRVIEVGGSRARWTLGGLLAFDRNESEVLRWA